MTQNPMYPPPPGTGGAGYGFPQPVPQQGNGFAIAGLVFSIIGFCVPLLGGLIGTILGIVGLRKTRNPGVGGKGMSIAAIVVGIISMILSTVVVGLMGAGGVMAWQFTKQARATTQTFVQDVAAQNTAAVRANVTDDYTNAEIEAAGAKLHKLGTFKDATTTQLHANNNDGLKTMHISGIATFSNGSASYEIDLENVNGVWKVSSASFH